jgi:hypothetical protein
LARKYSSTTPDTSFDDARAFLWNDPSDKNAFPQSTVNYELLLDSFTSSDFVSFTGAGVSKALGIDDWDKLIDKLRKVAEPEGFTEKKPIIKNEYPEYIERLFRHLESKSRKELYFNTIKDRMAPRTNSTSLTLIYLSLCINIHLTTNFDRSIEHAYSCVDFLTRYFKVKRSRPQPQKCYINNLNATASGPTIIYLHGSETQDTYILKQSDYDCFYPSVSRLKTGTIPNVEECLKSYYCNKTILFIGFSFEDPYVYKYFFNLAKEIERNEETIRNFYSVSGKKIPPKKIRHFLLISKDNTFTSNYRNVKTGENEIFSELQKFNLYPIIYTGEHIFLEHLFKGFANKNRGI